jgi:hypothetical protein
VLFLFLCTSVGLLPLGESPIAVSNNNNNNIIIIKTIHQKICRISITSRQILSLCHTHTHTHAHARTHTHTHTVYTVHIYSKTVYALLVEGLMMC